MVPNILKFISISHQENILKTRDIYQYIIVNIFHPCIADVENDNSATLEIPITTNIIINVLRKLLISYTHRRKSLTLYVPETNSNEYKVVV